MNRPRILDLYCGAGAVSRGLVDAGFDVVGVDIEPQPRYPYAFIQADALALDMRFIRSFDAVHASPPCQGYTALRHAPNAKDDHPKLIGPTRDLLQLSGRPWVIENVEQAKRAMRNPLCLCGSMFNLGAAGHQLRRHRLFECSFAVDVPPCTHATPVIGIYGGHVRNRGARSGGRGTRDFIGHDKPALARLAMGVERAMTMEEISQGIPPAYTEFVGRTLLAHLEAGRVAA